MRAEDLPEPADPAALPIGQVVQVYSLYCDVEHDDGKTLLCIVRKTLTKITGGDIVVGDRVRFRDLGPTDESGQPQAVVEQILPRETVLTRADSFKAIEAHPIVANAQQMLIVASVRQPNVKWGLIDRMIVAAKSGGLEPIVCVNKMDLARAVPGLPLPPGEGGGEGVFEDQRAPDPRTSPHPVRPRSPQANPLPVGEGTGRADRAWAEAEAVLAHYASLGIRILRTSVVNEIGLDELRDLLRDRVTVLAGHSGVGKSSLIRAIQPALDLRIGALSGYTGKGRHTTTSARRYLLDIGGYVIDTPGVKLFGLWGVTRENLDEYFPDVADESAPEWRKHSYQRILESLSS